MRAIIAKERGAKGVIADVPMPKPNAGEVLVRVLAASINPVDWKSIERGDGPFPKVMGQDFAGIVVDTGDDVDAIHADDRVFGIARKYGAFAEYTVIPQRDREQPVAILPHDVEDTDAAALPTAGLTALLAVESLERQSGDTIMIVGVAGGVGSFAAQIALRRGLRVIGTASSKSEAFVRNLGDIDFIPYDLEDPIKTARSLTNGAGVDGVIDLIDGPDDIRIMADAIKPGGTIISTIGALDEPWFAERNVTANNIVLPKSTYSSPEALTELAEMIERGDITVKIADITELSSTPAALEESRHGSVNGKIIVSVV